MFARNVTEQNPKWDIKELFVDIVKEQVTHIINIPIFFLNNLLLGKKKLHNNSSILSNIGLETTKIGHITTHQACTYCHGTKIFIKWKCEECAGTGAQIFGQDFGYV